MQLIIEEQMKAKQQAPTNVDPREAVIIESGGGGEDAKVDHDKLKEIQARPNFQEGAPRGPGPAPHSHPPPIRWS